MTLSSSNISRQDNTTSFGECLKLPYYSGVVENWIIAVNSILVIINVVSVLITITANTVFLFAYFKTRSLRTPHYFFLMLLAITDVCVGLITQPLFISRKIMEIYDIHDCVLWTAVRATVYYFSGISFLTLTLVSIERYYAVCRPIRHRKEVTESRMGVVASSVWVIWLAFPIVRFVFPEFYRVFAMAIGGVILLLFAVNACIYWKIRQCVVGKGLNSTASQVRGTKGSKDMEREARLAKTIACLILVMVLAYLPTAIGLGYKAVVGVNTVYMFVFLPIADTLVLVNSSFNPLFYCYKNKNIRDAILKCAEGKKIMKNANSTTTTLECITCH